MSSLPEQLYSQLSRFILNEKLNILSSSLFQANLIQVKSIASMMLWVLQQFPTFGCCPSANLNDLLRKQKDRIKKKTIRISTLWFLSQIGDLGTKFLCVFGSFVSCLECRIFLYHLWKS